MPIKNLFQNIFYFCLGFALFPFAWVVVAFYLLFRPEPADEMEIYQLIKRHENQ